jgi:hypothetical protein
VTFLVRKPPGSAPESKIFYPRALVVLTVTMDTLRELGPVPRSKFGGALFDPNAGRVFTVAVPPSSMRVTRNSYREPDGFEAEMDIRACPLTPKQIRACNVSALLWSSPVDGPPVDAVGNFTERPIFEGLVDEVTASYEDGGHALRISGQDYTALFSRRQWDPRRRAPAGKRLDQHLTDLIAEGQVGGAGDMRLRVEPESLRAHLPIVGAKAVRTNKKGKPVVEKSSWWDVMYEMAIGEAFILFVEGTDVVLTRPQVLHESRGGDAQRLSDLTALSKRGPQRPVYSFAWGRNLARLEVQRNFGKEVQPIIEVLGHDQRGNKLVVRYPRKGEKAPVGVGTDRDRVEQAVMDGAASESTLREYARMLYELRAKGEQSLAFGTDDLTDLNGFSVLGMRAGDAAAIDIDVFNTEELLRLDEGTRRERLAAAGFEGDAPDYIARNMDVVDQLKGPFRVREVGIDFSADQGVSIDVECQEFVRLGQEPG